MAYNIVKHRRGTTDEWKSLNLVPESGELVIEECLDGTRKCKIGDGTTTFLELPYLDDSVRSLLLKQLADVRATFTEKLAGVALTQDSQLAATRNELEALSNTTGQLTIATEALETQLQNSKDALETLINNKATDSSTALSALKTDTQKQLADFGRVQTGILIDLQNFVTTSELEEEFIDVNKAIAELETVKDQLSSIHEELIRLDAVDDDLRGSLQTSADELKNTSNKLVSQISTLATASQRAQVTLLAEMTKAAKTQKSYAESAAANLLAYVTRIYAELADLVDDDIMILRKVVALQNTLTPKMDMVLADFETLPGQVRGAVDEANAASAAVDIAIENFDKKIDQVNTDLEEAHKRIDLFTKIQAGETDGNAELLELRIGYDGNEYDTARQAVVQIGNDLNAFKDKAGKDIEDAKADLYTAINQLESDVANEIKTLTESLPSYLPKDSVDGLHYDSEFNKLYLTSNGLILEDSAVEIQGGGGGGPSTTSELRLNYLTQSPVAAKVNDKTILKFTFSGVDSSGDAILQANATWKVNNKIVEYGFVTDGENEFDVTKYLNIGTNNVLLSVVDDNGTLVTKPWQVQQIQLSVDYKFNDKIAYPVGRDVTFSYIPTGAVEKTAVVKLDNDDNKTVRFSIPADISGGRDYQEYFIPAQSHGAHRFEFYIEADIYNNGKPIESEHIIKDIIFYDPNSELPVIGISETEIDTTQYVPVNIVYTVYDPKADIPFVTIYRDGKEEQTLPVPIDTEYGTPTGKYSYSESTVGTHTIKITCRDVERVITINVASSGITVKPPDSKKLAFDFNPVGRSNSDTVNRLWTDPDRGVSMTVSKNFDWTNGGYIPDDPDGPCFCIKAGSTATFDHLLFADDATLNGKSFKLIFKTKNVANPDTIFLKCLKETGNVGLEMGVYNAHIYGQSGSLELTYSENDRIEFEFNISKADDDIPMVMGYEDGVPSRPMVYNSTFSFTQVDKQPIIIGSADCDVYIYRLRVYNSSLTDREILQNFITDASTSEEMKLRFDRNQIYDENGNLTPEVLAEKCPDLRVYKLSAPRFTRDKKDKVARTTIQQIYKNGHPVLDNWTCYNAQHSGQGTSSNNYAAAGRNLDFIMNKSGLEDEGIVPYFELGDGSRAETITLSRESVPVAYLNAKVNIASSNNLTNALLAKKYNTFNVYNRPFAERDGINTDYIKDTMEFYNCVIFIQETDPDISTHEEFADTKWHFYAIGNIGDSKKTDNTRATDPDDKYECCVEIMDVGLPLSDFPLSTMWPAMGKKKDKDTGEMFYIWLKDENLDKLYEVNGEFIPTSDTDVVRGKVYYKQVNSYFTPAAYVKKADLAFLFELNGSFQLTSDTTIVFDEQGNSEKVYYIDILEHDDFSEAFTYGWRYLYENEDNKEESTEVFNTCKQKWIDFYRFVTTASDEDFKTKLSDYFVVDSALYYYLFTTRYCMVDNRAKNTFWHYGKTADGTRKWDLCWDYDNDTSLGLNNYGKQVYRYGLEDVDKDASGTEVFRESDSTFFCRIRDLFADKLYEMYQDLDSEGAWNAESFIKACDNWQNEFPEELWRLDIERKYLRTYNSSFIDKPGNPDFLEDMCNGRMKYHRRQWERDQERYMASKYQTTLASAAGYNAQFRFQETNSAMSTVAADYQFTLTPASYIYLTVRYGSGDPVTVRAQPNVPTTVPYAGVVSFADLVYVYSANAIKDFGDLSRCYPKTVDISYASRVKTLSLGNATDGYDNPGFDTLATESNPLLEEINIENISGLTKSLDFSALVNLKKLFAFGTGIPSVLFAPGGKIEELELPAINNITLKQLKYLADDKLTLESYDNVVTLIVEDCPLLDQATLLNSCPNLEKVRLTDINFDTVTYEAFANKIFGLKGQSATGAETENAVLIGTVRFDNLTGAQFNDITERYKQLEVSYDHLESKITFKDTDLETVIHENIVEDAADYANPVYYGSDTEVPDGMIAKPVKTSTDEFEYVFLGWSTVENIIVSTEDTSNPLTDELRRVYREDAVKKVEGDRTLYPVFEAVRRSYPVTFINTTIKNVDDQVLDTVSVLYGNKAVYTGQTPEKLDAESKDLFIHSGWITASGISMDDLFITGDTTFYATFTENDDEWHIIEEQDLYDQWDGTPNKPAGFKLDTSNNTITIEKCYNTLNTAYKVPDKLTISGNGEFTVTAFKGFSGFNQLEAVRLADSIITLLSSAFYNCNKLPKVVLPQNLETIGSQAFAECTSLASITIPATVTSIYDDAFANCASLSEITVEAGSDTTPEYFVDQGCLINASTGKIVRAQAQNDNLCIPKTVYTPAGETIHITSLGSYSFSKTHIKKAQIPDGVTLNTYTFKNCTQLKDLTLPVTLRAIPSSCFSSCTSLANVSFPDSTLTEIGSYAFSESAIETLEIPASVNTISSRAFASMPNLTTVTFLPSGESRTLPTISHEMGNNPAFLGSGGDQGVEFTVPWTFDEHVATYGTFDKTTKGTNGKVKDPTFGVEKYRFNFSDGTVISNMEV